MHQLGGYVIGACCGFSGEGLLLIGLLAIGVATVTIAAEWNDE